MGGTDHRARGESAQHSALAPAGPPSRSERTFLGLEAPEPRGGGRGRAEPVGGAAGAQRAGPGSDAERGGCAAHLAARVCLRHRPAGSGFFGSAPPSPPPAPSARSLRPVARPAMGAHPRGVRPAKLSPLPAAPLLLLLLLPGTGAGQRRPGGPSQDPGSVGVAAPSTARRGRDKGLVAGAPHPAWSGSDPAARWVGACVRVSPSNPPFLRVFRALAQGAGRPAPGACPPQPGATDSSPSPACRPAWRTGAPRPRVPLSACRPPPPFTNRWGS